MALRLLFSLISFFIQRTRLFTACNSPPTLKSSGESDAYNYLQLYAHEEHEIRRRQSTLEATRCQEFNDTFVVR